MRYFDKLLNFFTSSYSNNTRFHHSTLGYLKIFFERNNKLKSTFTSLGNVFRNSKWSDLKVQNIKTSFIKSWSSYFLATSLVLCLILSFFGIYTGGAITTQIPFIGDIYEILCFSWTHTEDLFKALLLSIASIFSYVKSALIKQMRTKQSYIYESLRTVRRYPSSVSSNILSPLALSKSEVSNHATIEIMYALAHASKSVHNIDPTETENIYEFQSYSDSLNISDCLNWSTVDLANASQPLNLSNIEYSYTVTPANAMFVHQFDTESSNLNKINTYNTALAVTNLNTQDALKNAKQDRWLVRNSLLSENLILNSNAFTQSKKLLGINFLNSEAASKNVWSSTKLNALDTSSSTNFISNLQELFSNQPLRNDSLAQLNFTNPNLDNFNFFENSRMWLVKKYFFTNQLKNNLTQASPLVASPTNISMISTNTHNYTLFLNLYNQSPQSQLNYLSLCIEPSHTSSNSASVSCVYDFYINAGDADIFKSNNLSFLNKLTYSTSNESFKYYTTLTQTNLLDTTAPILNFQK